MARTDDFAVEAHKKLTYLDVIEELYPTIGNVPLDIEMRCALKDSVTHDGIDGKTVKLWMSKNGEKEVVVASDVSHSVGVYPMIFHGRLRFDYTIKEAGSYLFYAEFEGDTIYEGCKESSELKTSKGWGCEDE